jgi:hypothetical protein
MDGDDMDRVRSRMAALKLMQQAVNPVDEYRMEMNNMIQAKKRDIPGLVERVMELRHTDSEMFDYISDLERLHNSIWCARCDKLKIYQYSESTIEDARVALMQEMYREIAQANSNLRNMKTEFTLRIEEQERIIARLQADMQHATGGPTTAVPATAATTAPTAVPTAVPTTDTPKAAPARSHIIDLDIETSKKQLEIPEFLLPESESMSADDLLFN